MSGFSSQRLIDGQRQLTTPFTVELDGGSCECLEVLRLLPGKRLVARARYQARDVVVKLFVGRGARRRCTREKIGVTHLLASSALSPGLVDATLLADGRGWALVFEYVADARPVLVEDRQAAEQIADTLGHLHTDGVVHRDLHLDNFMLSRNRVYVVDGDSVKKVRGALSETPSLGYLAEFLAQYPPSEVGRLEGLMACYERARGWSARADRLSRLTAAVVAARKRRVRHFLAKTQRACTEFVQVGNWRSNVLARRADFNEPLRTFAEDPETHLTDAQIIKAGNSATVFRVVIGNEPVIVKRYNVKSFWHRVRRWFKPRARSAWRNGHRLRFLCIPTADPILLVECRWGPFAGLAYLVMADRGDANLAIQVASCGWQPAWLDAVVGLFADLRTAGLQHRDTKATNFLVDNGGVYLIDLDGMTELRGSALTAAQGPADDVRRFLDNWQGEDLVRVEERLREAGLA